MTTALSADIGDQLQAALNGICQEAGLSASDATLIKYTMNAVYRVGDHVVRLANDAEALQRSSRLVAVMKALTAAGAPVIGLTAGIPQPVTSGDWIATIWDRVDTVPRTVEPIDLAQPLRRLHAIDGQALTSIASLPKWDLLEKIFSRIDATETLPEQSAAETSRWADRELGRDLKEVISWLRDWATDLSEQLDRAQWILPNGPIHADAHTGNLLLPPQQPGVLCDLDGVCDGPREWDLTPTAHGVTRFGRSRHQYQSFTTAYGIDITTWDNWPLLRNLRELQLVTSVLPTLTGRPAVACELGHRMRSLLTGDATITWSRYT